MNQEFKRCSRVARLLPDEATLLRLAAALPAETSEEWETGKTNFNRECLTQLSVCSTNSQGKICAATGHCVTSRVKYLSTKSGASERRSADLKTNPLVAMVLALGIGSAAALTPWVSQTAMTEATLDSRLSLWSPPPYNLAPVCLSGYDDSGTIRYAALWAPVTDGLERHVIRGATSSEFVSANAIVQALGYRLIWIHGFQSGGADYFNAIYRRSYGEAQTVRLGESLSTHQTSDTTLSGQGNYLDNLSAYATGTSVRYAAWWTAGVIVPQMRVTYGLTPADYQQEFNTYSGSWRLHNVCGYKGAFTSENRFTVVWRKPALGDWSASHGITRLNYAAVQANETTIGRRPVLQHAWANGTNVYFNGLWVADGGLAGSWVSQLDQSLAALRSTRSIPGLSVAVSRRGRLVFARAYGLADQEADELAGPEHRWRVASVSKPVCSVAVMHTLEHNPQAPGWTINSRLFGTSNFGILGNDYGTPPYSTRELALRLHHVLRHTAGWANDGYLWWHDQPAWGSDPKPAIDYQLDTPVSQSYDPGDFGRYSNLGYVIAARVVEKLNGQNFEDYTVNEVLSPCGISGISRMVVGERTRAQQKSMEVAYYPGHNFGDDPYVIDPRRMDGSTAWVARPLDLLLLARRVDGNATHTDILSSNSVVLLRTPANPLPVYDNDSYNPQTYGLGWSTDNINAPTQWGHNGGMAGTRADFVVRLDGVSFAWVGNTDWTWTSSADNPSAIIGDWVNQIDAAEAWPDIDLFYSAHPAYDAWAATNFTSTDRGQPGLRISIYGPDADPDGDHLPNAGEAYFDFDPLVANGSPLSVAKVGSHLRIRWQRSTTERGVVAGLQTSSDLLNWFTPIGISIVDRPDLLTTVGKLWQEVLLPISGAKQFARIVYRTH